MEDKKGYETNNFDSANYNEKININPIIKIELANNNSLVYSDDLLDKYSDEYFRTLVILFHINELYQKQQKYIAEDKKPMKQIEFTKELADLYIFLDILKTLDPSFNDLVNQRLNKIENIAKEEKENKERSNE